MAQLDKKALIPMIEGIKPGQTLVFQLSKTFGEHYVVVNGNPAGDKKPYTVRFGQELESTRTAKPLFLASKAKEVAAWLGDRSPVLVERDGQPVAKSA